MVSDLHVSAADIKLTMTIFLISYGIGQLLLGRLVDSYGRYQINLVSLSVFILCNVGIILTSRIDLILLMRSIQGLAIALIMVSRRAFFIDVYAGEKRKYYTSLLTVVWSTAPIIAPFAGGYLQSGLGWRANFYFLAIYAFVMLVLELIYGGETILTKQPFHPKAILRTYGELLKAYDFSIGILVLGLSYAMVMVFGMAIPFIVEHGFNLSPVVTGYCALISGGAIFAGGLFAKQVINRPLERKLRIANLVQIITAIAMFMTGAIYYNLYTIIIFVVIIHFFQGFTYNTYFTYAVNRFPAYAATASGVVSGASYVVFSIVSYLIAGTLRISDQKTLSLSYIVILACIIPILALVNKALSTSGRSTRLRKYPD